MTGSARQLVWEWWPIYDPFATDVGFQGLFFIRLDEPASPLAYGAQGFYYTRNRIYDPVNGRYLQKDKNATALALVSVAAMNGEAASAPVDAFDLMALYADGMNLYGFSTARYGLHTQRVNRMVGELQIHSDEDERNPCLRTNAASGELCQKFRQ